MKWSRETSRRRFLKKILAGAVFLPGAMAFAGTANRLRAERVDWVRLATPNPNWQIHSDRDAALAQYIRTNTSLDISKAPAPADPTHLDQLCGHPFVYAKDLRQVSTDAQLANIAEYLRRGGFLCVDPCATEAVNPDMEVCLRANCDIFKQMFPAVRIQKLPETHGIYNCYFKLSRADVYTPDMGNQKRCANYGVYGVSVDDRMVAVLDSTRFCETGWRRLVAGVGAGLGRGEYF